MSVPQVLIRCLDLQLQAASDDPSAAALRDDFAGAAKAELCRSIAAAAASLDPRTCVHLRELHVDLDFVGTDPTNEIAGEIGRRIGRAIADAAADDAGVTFASAADRLGAYCLARARGGGGEWWFSAFADLRPVLASSAIRMALARDPDLGAAALAALDPAARAAVLMALDDGDASRLLSALGGGPRQWRGAASAAAAIVAALARPPSVSGTARVALWALASARRAAPDHDGATLAGIAQAAALVCELAAASTLKAEAVATALASARIELLSPSAALIADRLAALAALPAAVRRPLLALVRSASSVALPEIGAGEAAGMPFAGLALIWPELDELCHAALGGDGAAIDRDGTPAAGALTLLALAAAAGCERAPDVWRDPVWRTLFGIAPRCSLWRAVDWLRQSQLVGATRLRAKTARLGAADRAWLAGLPRSRGPARRFVTGLVAEALARFARRLPGFAEASAPFLWTNLLAVAGNVRIGEAEIEVTIGRPPLDVLLAITRLADRDVALADGRRLVLRRSPP